MPSFHFSMEKSFFKWLIYAKNVCVIKFSSWKGETKKRENWKAASNCSAPLITMCIIISNSLWMHKDLILFFLFHLRFPCTPKLIRYFFYFIFFCTFTNSNWYFRLLFYASRLNASCVLLYDCMVIVIITSMQHCMQYVFAWLCAAHTNFYDFHRLFFCAVPIKKEQIDGATGIYMQEVKANSMKIELKQHHQQQQQKKSRWWWCCNDTM